MAYGPIRRIETASSSRRRKSGFTTWPKQEKAPDFSTQQMFALAMAKESRRPSFMDRIKDAGRAAFTPVEWTFDKILRPSYGMAEGVREGLGDPKETGFDFGDSLHGFREGFMGRKKTGFGDVLEQEGKLKGHRRLRGAAGFVMDVAFDPTTYLTFGTSAIASTGGKSAGVAFKAGREAIEGSALKAGEWKAVEGTLKEAGEAYRYRAALAGTRAEMASKKAFTKADNAKVAIGRETAKREEARFSQNLPQIGFKLGPINLKTPVTVAGTKIVPSVPKVGQLLTKAPVVGGVARGFQKTVGSGIYNPERGLRVTQKHLVEELSDDYLRVVREIVEPMPKLDVQRAVAALHHFERPGGVVKTTDKQGNVDYVINDQRMSDLRKQGVLDEAQEAFVRGWHDISQYFHATDRSFGIGYVHQGEHGKLYVPHLVDRQGLPYTRAEKSLLKQAGYTKQRGHGNLTLKQLYDLNKEGRLPRGVEIDPFKIMVNMARTRAHQHADKSAVDFLASGFGVKTRKVDANKLSTLEKKKAIIEGKMAKYTKGMKNLKQYKAMAKEHEKLDAQVKKTRRGTKNKEARNDMVELDRLRDEFGHKIVVPREIGAALQRVEKIVDPTEDESIQSFARAWYGMQGRWKVLVTAINPGYRMRNTLSDFWNMYVSGVPTWAFVRYGGRAAKVMRGAKNFGNGSTKAADRKAAEALVEAYHAGILSGLYGGDIQTIAQMLRYAGSKRSMVKRGRVIKLGTKVAHDANRNAENWGRLVHYLYRREHEGKSVVDAAWNVKKAHFDYEDLTEFERRKLKGIAIPFYTWTRKNVPFQIQAIISRPGKYSAFPKLANESEYAAGDTEGDIVPDYMTQNFSFKVPFGKDRYLTPQIGASDLARFQTPGLAGKNIASMLSPAFKIPAEVALNKQLYTGQPIDEGRRTPMSEWASPFVGLLPKSDVGPTSRSTGPNEGRVTGSGMSPWFGYAFGQTPWTRFGFLNQSKIRKAQKNVSPAWSQIGGLTFTELDQEQQLLIERMELRDRLERRVKKMRDAGELPQATRAKPSPYERTLLEQLQMSLGR